MSAAAVAAQWAAKGHRGQIASLFTVTPLRIYGVFLMHSQ